MKEVLEVELALELAESGSSPSLARNIVPGECSVAVWREGEGEGEGEGDGRGRGRGGEGREGRGRGGRGRGGGGTDEAQICNMSTKRLNFKMVFYMQVIIQLLHN